MTNIKLNSSRHESHNFKIRRKNTFKKAVNSNKAGLIPSPKLNNFGKQIFKSIVHQNKQLQSSDNANVNILCHEYEIYVKTNDHLRKYGLVTDDGKRSPYYQILKQTIDLIMKINSQLDLTPDHRLNAELHHAPSEKHDPVKEVFR